MTRFLIERDRLLEMERLTRLRGIGRWTAEYVMLRGLGRWRSPLGDNVGAHNSLSRHFDLDTPLDSRASSASWRAGSPTRGWPYFRLLLDSLSRSGLVSAP